jgi:hypothetical protein
VIEIDPNVDQTNRSDWHAQQEEELEEEQHQEAQRHEVQPQSLGKR